MQLEKVYFLNSKKEYILFTQILIAIFSYSILIEYNNYLTITKFDSVIVDATITKQYTKTKKTSKNKLKTYQILKLKSTQDLKFYTTVKEKFPYSQGKKIKLKIFTNKLTFYQYLTSFYSYSKILEIDNKINTKLAVNKLISLSHQDNNISAIYQALYTANPLPRELQTIFSTLGISHLFAISGFHLSVLAALLFFLFKLPYHYLQNRYFPFRSYKLDSFILISSLLFMYLLLLDFPPSLLRAYSMLIIGFLLYDRGYEVISMHNLFLTIVILLALFPRLFFELGFWLSASGVFYIFLFLIHFDHLKNILQFILMPVWVYLMMLTLSLVIFSNFSLYHPLSIIWTSLFSLFYPTSIFLHLLGLGDILDPLLQQLLELSDNEKNIKIDSYILYLHMILSFLSLLNKRFIWLLTILSSMVLGYSMYMIL